MPVEHGPHFLGSVSVISGKLDLAVADLRDLSELALEVLLHFAPDGVELHADFFYLASIGRPGELAG